MTKPEGPAQDEQRENFRKSLEHEMMPTTTPAPSQPAGAREWRVGRKVPINVYDERGNPVCQCQTPAYAEIIVKSVNAAKQTAAKDADEPTPQEIIAAYDRAIKDKQAAERERDSLRAENAALKAGKDGKK